MKQTVSNHLLKHVMRGTAVFIISLILSLAIAASLIYFNIVIIQHEAIMTVTVLIISSYFGAKTAVQTTECKRYIICAILAVLFIVLLYLCSVLVNVSEIKYLGAKIMVITCGAALPVFHKRSKTKKYKSHKRK